MINKPRNIQPPSGWREPQYIASSAIAIEANKAFKTVRVHLPCGDYKDFHAQELERLVERFNQAIAWLKEDEMDSKRF